MPQRIQLRRGTASEWNLANPVLAAGEFGVEHALGADKIKVGDGVSTWEELAYFTTDAAALTAADVAFVPVGTIGSTNLQTALAEVASEGTSALAAESANRISEDDDEALARIAGDAAEATARTAGDAALDVRVDALEAGGGGSTAGPVTVMYLGRNPSVAIAHDIMWPTGRNLGPFSWEAWVAPYGGYSLERTSTGGTFTLTYQGQTTAPIPASVAGFTVDNVQAALDGLSNVDPGDITVSLWADHGFPGWILIDFGPALLGKPHPTITANVSGTTGGTVNIRLEAAEYWISEGFGGAHAILAGFGGFIPAGNIWTGVTTTSFASEYLACHGEWLHYRVTWNGIDTLFLLINGIVCGQVPFAGPRQAQFGDLMIGGSDHSNFKGMVAAVRAWEGMDVIGVPWYGRGPARADRYFGDRISPTGPAAQFLTSYLGKLESFEDRGEGFNGSLHPGTIRGRLNFIGQDNPGFAHPVAKADPTAPFGPQHNVPRTRVFATPGPVPVGAKIYDSFGRPDSILAFESFPSIGSTEGGSLGVQDWQGPVGGSGLQDNWGIFDGSAVCFDFGVYARVAVDSADMDVRVRRSYNPSAHMWDTACAARLKADLSSGWIAYTSSQSGVHLLTPAGADAGGWVTPTGWTWLRLTTVGTTISCLVDDGVGGWTLLGSVTSSTNAAEVGAGLYNLYGIGTMARYKEFVVF
jgi:hypothetical protein